jgi:hypothetical protein
MPTPAPPPGPTWRLAGQLLEALATGDQAALGAIVTHDVRGRTPSLRFGGLAALQRGVGSPNEAFEDVALSVEEVTCAPPRFVAQWQLEARHTGMLQVAWAEVEGTGRLVSVEGALIGSTGQGRINAFALYHDEITLLEQLGLL